MGEKISRNFRETRKQFWREVNNVRKVGKQVLKVVPGTYKQRGARGQECGGKGGVANIVKLC